MSYDNNNNIIKDPLISKFSNYLEIDTINSHDMIRKKRKGQKKIKDNRTELLIKIKSNRITSPAIFTPISDCDADHKLSTSVNKVSIASINHQELINSGVL